MAETQTVARRAASEVARDLYRQHYAALLDGRHGEAAELKRQADYASLATLTGLDPLGLIPEVPA